MIVRYTPRAFADREAIFAYIEQRNPAAARTITAYIAKRISELGALPHRGRVLKDLGIYALWLGRYPYIVYYRVRENEVDIIHIRHAARRPLGGRD